MRYAPTSVYTSFIFFSYFETSLWQNTGERTRDPCPQAADSVCWTADARLLITKNKKCPSEELPDACCSVVSAMRIAAFADTWHKTCWKWTSDLEQTWDLFCRHHCRHLVFGTQASSFLFVQKIPEKNGIGQWMKCLVALWNLFLGLFCSQHKGSVESVFTNNTDVTKENVVTPFSSRQSERCFRAFVLMKGQNSNSGKLVPEWRRNVAVWHQDLLKLKV